ncbi:MAG: DUF2785 domain-containing protein [Candidatus Heimdallarchaeota archaeon]|nr:DUF2785 domain-containing protein [Candidatus Heimdallarchaeota archaeon]
MKLSEILSIIENDYDFPDRADLQKITSELEANLGSIELDIRDKSFEILYEWCAKGLYSDSELLALGNRMATNLFVGLGESETDSVFLRSFSALTFCGVLNADRIFSEGKIEGRKSFLTSDLLNKWLDKTIEFFIGEQDFRGYLDDKSWAHSIAHCGDLFRQFANNQHSKKNEHIKILDALAKKLVHPTNQIFSTNEDGRLCRVVATIWMRNLLSLEDYEKWLQQIISPFSDIIWNLWKLDPSTFNVRLNARVNSRLFLHSLYFILLFGSQGIFGPNDLHFKRISEYRDLVAQGIKKLDSNGFYYHEEK